MKQGRGSSFLRKSAKRIGRRVFGLALMTAMLPAGTARTDDEEAAKKLIKAFAGIQFGLLAYVDYSAGQSPLPEEDEQNYNRFALTRGYVRLTKDFRPWLGAHVTTDIHQETKENLAGSYVFRLKYYYAFFKPPDLGPLTQMKSEIGMGHVPWLDFEENLNPYRCQGTMAIERAGVFNSADLGVSLMGNLGGKLEDAEKKTGNKSYDGKYGSWHLGGYNGAGYSAAENNQNKVVEGRLSLRPLPNLLPGLQLSYFGLVGEGNAIVRDTHDQKVSPDYAVQLGMVSFEHPAVTVTGQYFATLGNQKGSWVTSRNVALPTEGYSGFLRVRVPGTKDKLAVFGRYDYFNPDREDHYSREAAYRMWFTGLAYDVYRGNLILVDYERTDYQDASAGKGNVPKKDNRLGDENKWQVVLQIKL